MGRLDLGVQCKEVGLSGNGTDHIGEALDVAHRGAQVSHSALRDLPLLRGAHCDVGCDGRVALDVGDGGGKLLRGAGNDMDAVRDLLRRHSGVVGLTRRHLRGVEHLLVDGRDAQTRRVKSVEPLLQGAHHGHHAVDKFVDTLLNRPEFVTSAARVPHR